MRATATRRLQFEPDPQRLIDLLGDRLPDTDDQPRPSHVVRIVRPDDLVVLQVSCFDIDLVDGGAGAHGPVLTPTNDGAYLVVTLTFQHIAEQAFSLIDGEDPVTPVQVLVAEPSRVAYSVPAGTRIAYSSAGILAALSQLPLRVVPVATPRPVRLGVGLGLGDLAPVVTLPGGLQLAHADAGVLLTHQAGRQRASAVISATDTLIGQASSLRVARALLAEHGAVDLTGLLGAQPVGTRRPLSPDAGISRTGLGDVITRPLPPVRPTRQPPRRPNPDETAIEAPWRLFLSPSSQGAFTHATEPRAAEGDPDRVELWHSRLGVRQVATDGTVSVDETSTTQRVVRAVWARDKDGSEPTAQNNLPFRMSLSGLDRIMLVRQSADNSVATPEPVDVTRLYLSSQGAWLDLHGKWEAEQYAPSPAIESWDHIAPMGRDQYVKVEYPGYLFPFGHRCSLIKVTERRIDDTSGPVAWLYQRKFIVVREPVRTYSDLDMPFIQVRVKPVVTPDLKDPLVASTPNVIDLDQLFWPTVGNDKFQFTLECLDHDGKPVTLPAPLLFVGITRGTTAIDRKAIQDAYTTPDSGQPAPRAIPAFSQNIAYAKSSKPGDTSYETIELRFTGDPGIPKTPTALHSQPHLSGFTFVVPAMKKLAPQAPPVTGKYAGPYLTNGFTGPNATPQVFLELDAMTPISFGKAAGGSTEKSGGFVQPDLPVRGLSRSLGTVGQVGSIVNPPAGKQPFEPLDFLDGVLPKLFGLFSLVDILQAVGLDKAPQFVTEQLGDIAGMLDDLQSAQQALIDGTTQLAQEATTAATAPLRQAATDAHTALQTIESQFTPAFSALTNAISAFGTSGDADALQAAAKTALDDLAHTITDLGTQVGALSLPPVVKARLQRVVDALKPLTALAGQAAKILERISQIIDFVKGLDPDKLSVKASFEWRPKLQNFPKDKDKDSALFYVDPDGLLLSIEARASGADGVGVDVLAELRNFGLNLFMDATLIRISFDRLSFRSSNGRKPEVDVVMNQMQWQGVLSFIATLEELIPSDGFADPPYVDVSADGVKAGFDLALPNVAVGVFSLENISLGADVAVPFLGDAVTVGFHFCTREKPFRLTVLCVGGGGFVGLRISPKGIVLLEMSLEACAQLAIDLGVASGSVSISVGVYLRLEGDDGSLTGYFRIRGEVDVLGLISASITLELSLTYEFNSGKLVGRASIEVEVEVLFFSFSVTVSCERRLAGSNNDPTFAEFLGIAADGTVPNPGAPDGGVPAWTDYCTAFAGV